MGATYTPSKSAIRDQVHGSLLRLGGIATVQAVEQVPLNVLPGTRGDLALDTRNGALWIKTTGEPNGAPSTDGWVQINAGDSPSEYGAINWDGPPPVAQSGSELDFVDVLGPGVLATPASAFSSPSANRFLYTGVSGAFFARAQIGIVPQEAASVSMRFRVAVNGVAVPNSESYIIRASVQGFVTSTSAQVNLATGDVVSFQFHNQGGGLPVIAWSFGAQIDRAD